PRCLRFLTSRLETTLLPYTTLFRSVGESGAFDLLPSDVEPTDTGAWIDIEEEVALAAGESAVVPFTITVPEDALPGEHPGGVVAYLRTTARGEDGGAGGLDSRAGAQQARP